jgi:hypothetical protein
MGAPTEAHTNELMFSRPALPLGITSSPGPLPGHLTFPLLSFIRTQLWRHHYTLSLDPSRTHLSFPLNPGDWVYFSPPFPEKKPLTPKWKGPLKNHPLYSYCSPIRRDSGKTNILDSYFQAKASPAPQRQLAEQSQRPFAFAPCFHLHPFPWRSLETSHLSGPCSLPGPQRCALTLSFYSLFSPSSPRVGRLTPEGIFGGLRYRRPTLSHEPLSPVWWAPETALLRGTRPLSQSPSNPGVIATLDAIALSSPRLRTTAGRGHHIPRNGGDVLIGPVTSTRY